MEKVTKSKAKVFWYAVIITQESRFEQVLIGDTKRDLIKKIKELEKSYEEKDIDQFLIHSIIKGRKVNFKKVERVEF